jgi:hypothetical protein
MRVRPGGPPITTHPALSPTTLGPLELPNRLVVAPMTRVSATPDGVPTPEMVEYYAAFAAGGFGLVVLSPEHSQYAGRAGAVRDRLSQGVASPDQVDQGLTSLVRLRRRGGLRDRGERYVDRDLQQGEPVHLACLDQVVRRTRCLCAETEDDACGAGPADGRDERARRRLGEPETVGEHDLALTQVRRRVGQLGVVDPERLARERSVGSGDEQVELQRGVLQERGQCQHGSNVPTTANGPGGR